MQAKNARLTEKSFCSIQRFMQNPIIETKRDIQLFAAQWGNKRRLAREAGLREATLVGIERPEWNPNSDTLSALATAMLRLKRTDSSSRVV